MSGYVDRNCGGWTELRVHGVSGTPPDRILAHPHPVRVSGDAEAGFYRRQWEAEQTSADTADERLEAYSWGGLTAGKSQRALWLLLTPFLLVNIAFWALPPVVDTRLGTVTRRAAEAVQRLFALSITLTLVLSAVLVSMDFAGWQCGWQARRCTDRVSWLGFLSWSWLDIPGRRLAVTAAVPVAVVGLLWWLANKTWRELETTDVPHATPEEQQQTPLEDRRMWNGEGPVRRLRAVHVAAGFALVAVFLLVPFVPITRRWLGVALVQPNPDPFWELAASVLLALALGLLGLVVALTCLPSMSERARPKRDGHHLGRRRDGYTVLPWLALTVTILAAVVVWQSGPIAAERTGDPVRSPLPGVVEAAEFLAAVQLTLLLVVSALLLVLRALAVHAARSATAAPAPVQPSVWFGLTTAVLMMAASVLGNALTAGLALAVAHLLGKPSPTAAGGGTFVVPPVYFWTAALAVPMAVALVVLAGVGLWLVKHKAGEIVRNDVSCAYPSAGIDEAIGTPDVPEHAATLRRARDIAEAWARATVSDMGGRLTAAFAILLAGLIMLAVVGYRVDPSWVNVHVPWAVNIGDVLVGGFVVGFLYVGRQAYRNPRLRRTVGVLWDVGTFWPRATHPLAPPCYAERTVPDLIRRIKYLGCTCDGYVLLSCHSQGTVIGAAVVMQLTYEESARVGLLTYGSPLRRLYLRFFPAYFGVESLRRTGALLRGKPLDTAEGARRHWPWRNLYRPSDPVGGWVLRDVGAVEISPDEWTANRRIGDNQDVDHQLIDPLFAKAAGDSTYPATRGHSGYPDDPAYTACREIIRELRLAPRPSIDGDR